MLKMLGYGQNRIPDSHGALLQHLKFHGSDPQFGGTELNLFGTRYHYDTCFSEDEMILRLLPLKENEHFLRLASTLDVVPWGLMTIGVKGERPMILHCNKRAGDMMGIDPHRLIGTYADDVLMVFGIAENLDSYMRAKNAIHYDHEGRINDKVCWYRLHFIPYAMNEPYCLIVIEDTTDRKIMEGQYFQSQRLEALGQLAGGVAHDFNNILSIIDGYARLARKTLEEGTQAKKYMEHIAQAVQRGSALTGQLLTFGRHKVMKDRVVDFGALVSDQEPLIRPLMDASIDLTIKAEEGVYVDVTPDNICQILLNLCVNARDAMPDGGSLIVEAGKKEKRAFLRIIDTGCGMPPEVRSKMFDPFFTTKDQGKGTGLGLSMVYGLVKDMKGEIEVISKVGDGTSICVYLPLSDEKPAVKEISMSEDGTLHLEGYTALVAEDEVDLLDILSETLEDMGINVLRATNGNEALMVQDDYEGKIDFLLTDVVMPEMNGVRLAELFESVRPESQVMFMSGYPANNLMSRVNMPEDAVMVSKPVDMEKLNSVLRLFADKIREPNKEKWTAILRQWRTANA